MKQEIKESVKKTVVKIPSLPTLPSVAQDILMLVDDKTVSRGRLERIIERDPAISVRILSLANSAFWGTGGPVRSLDQAIFRIGFDSVKYLAVSVSVLTLFEVSSGKSRMHYQRMYNHSIATGFIAKRLARNLGLHCATEILMNGMLHDIGILVMNRYFSGLYQRVMESIRGGETLLAAEKEKFDFTHAEMGSWVAAEWHLHDSLVNTTLNHHVPSAASGDLKLAAVVHAADYLTNSVVLSPTIDDPGYSLDPACYEILGMSHRDFEDLESGLKGGELFNMLFTDSRGS
ncbi:MAG: HDOD domain-containing protein [Nitrospiraceae bacterium]|nr:MAG: HDOD domain-containing protein [Nitrospiraceae bacterium]